MTPESESPHKYSVLKADDCNDAIGAIARGLQDATSAAASLGEERAEQYVAILTGLKTTSTGSLKLAELHHPPILEWAEFYQFFQSMSDTLDLLKIDLTKSQETGNLNRFRGRWEIFKRDHYDPLLERARTYQYVPDYLEAVLPNSQEAKTDWRIELATYVNTIDEGLGLTGIGAKRLVDGGFGKLFTLVYTVLAIIARKLRGLGKDSQYVSDRLSDVLAGS